MTTDLMKNKNEKLKMNIMNTNNLGLIWLNIDGKI